MLNDYFFAIFFNSLCDIIYMDSQKRSITKTITFRIISSVVTMLLVYAFTSNWTMAGTIGVLDAVLKLFIYYFHERAWERISWGVSKK